MSEATITRGWWRATVIEVVRNSGSDRAGMWTQDIEDCRSGQFMEVAESIAEQASLDWYKDTLQEGPAILFMRVESWEGHAYSVRLTLEPVASVVNMEVVG